jgi:hypothetical protein
VASTQPGFYAPGDVPEVAFRAAGAVFLVLVGTWAAVVSWRTGVFMAGHDVVHRSQLGRARRVPISDIRRVGLAAETGQCLPVLDLGWERLRLDGAARWSLFDGPRRAEGAAKRIAEAVGRPYVDPLPDLDLDSDVDDDLTDD